MDKKKIIIIGLVIYTACVMVVFSVNVIKNGIGTEIDEENIGKMCIASAFPDCGYDDVSEVESASNEESAGQDSAADIKTTGVDVGEDPLVLIFHTHATESYMPSSGGNFHKLDKANTVRDAGDVLQQSLEEEGINVVHSYDLHDRPSYSQSYSKSWATATSLMKKYPSVDYVVDLHRDAAAYSGGTGKTVKIKGKTVAAYSLVIGKDNSNYNALVSYARKIIDTGNAMYPGFKGEIIYKDYKFNEELCNNDILLEIGNNQNTIEEARLCAKYMGKVMAQIIKADMQ